MDWLYAFALALARDYVATKWTKEVASGGSLKACIYSAICPILDLCSLFIWLHDWHAILATAAGYAAGTWLGMKGRKRTMPQNKKRKATPYFTPEDDCALALGLAVQAANHEVLLFASSLRLVSLGMALEAAKLRGVNVRIVLGPDDESHPASMLGSLFNAKISIKVDSKHAFVHERFLVIDESTVITGSFHYAPAMEIHSAGSLVVLENVPRLASEYRRNFLVHEAHARHPFSMQAVLSKVA